MAKAALFKPAVIERRSVPLAVISPKPGDDHMKLYYTPGACSLAAHIVAEEEELGLDYEKVDLKSHRTETGRDFYLINPKGYVPTLELDDRTVLTENVAILPFLADRRPDLGLAPPPDSMDRVRLLEWLGFITTELHKSFGPLFHKSAGASEAKNKIEKRLSLIDGKLAGVDYLMLGRFTVADAYLFVMLTWCGKFGIELQHFAELDAYHDRILARSAVQKAMGDEGLHEKMLAAE